MYNYDPATPVAPAVLASVDPSEAMLDEIHDHLVYVLKEKLHWLDATNPEMAMGGGHVVIRFQRGGQHYVFRVAKHGLAQHKRTMLAYRFAGHLGVMPEKVYHDGVSLLERHADGGPLTAQVTDVVLQRLANALGQLHAMPAQGFGPLDFDAQGSSVDANAYYQSQPAVDVDWSEMDLTDPQFKALSAAIQGANTLPPSLQGAPVRLGHGDLWRNNILVTHSNLKILDWDHVGAYPVERDLAVLLALDLSASQRALFFAHYAQRAVAKPELMRWFAKRHVLRDRGLQLDKKLAKIQAIDNLPLGAATH